MNNTAQFFARLARWSRRSNRFLTITAFLVVLSTAYVLMKPAITAEGSFLCGLEVHTHNEQCWETTIEYQPVLECGAAHTHSPSCYDENGALVCGYPDILFHVHNESCYDKDGNLVCPLPEITEHEHTDVCYDADGSLICDIPWHVHDESCFVQKEVEVRTLVCELPEHTHTVECFDIKPTSLNSDETYVHYHTDECYRDGTLVCTLSEPVEEPEPVVCERDGSELEPNLPEDYGDGVTVTIPEDAKVLLESGKVFENADTFDFTLTIDNQYPFVGQSWFEYKLPYEIRSSSGETVTLNTEPRTLSAGAERIGEWRITDNVILCSFDENSSSVSPVHLELPISVSDPSAGSGADEEIAEAPVEETGETPAEESEVNPDEETGETPAEESEVNPDEETEEIPAEESEEIPAEETEEASIEEGEKTSEKETGKAAEEEAFVFDRDADFMFSAKRLKDAAAPPKLLQGSGAHDGTQEDPHTVEDYTGAVKVSYLDDAEERLLSGDPFRGLPTFSFRLQIDNRDTYLIDSWFEYEIPFDWENHPEAKLTCAAGDYLIHAEGGDIGTWELTDTSIRCYFNENAKGFNNVHMLFTLTLSSGEDSGHEFDMKRPFVNVRKLDARTRKPLPGITFALFNRDGVELGREVTDSDGRATFYFTNDGAYLNFYEPYYIKEMYDCQPPEYISAYARDNREHWFVSISEETVPRVWEPIYSAALKEHPDIIRITQADREGYMSGTVAFELLNYPIYKLPETGGVSGLVCYAGGVVCLAAAAFLRKRRPFRSRK